MELHCPSLLYFVSALCVLTCLHTKSTGKAVDPTAADDENTPYSSQPRQSPSSQDSAPALLTVRSRALFTFNNSNFGTLGALLNNTRDTSSTDQPQARSSSAEDYPAYPIGGGGDYSGGFLGGGPGGSYGSGWGSKAQRVVYIAIPLNALSALLSANQLNTLGVGSIYPSLPPLGGGASYGGPPLRGVGSYGGTGGGSYSGGGASYSGGGGASYGGAGGASYGGGGGASYGSGGNNYVTGLSSGSNYGPSTYGAITYDSGPGLGQVLYGAVSGGASYSGAGGGSYGGSSGSYSSGSGGGYGGGGYDSGSGGGYSGGGGGAGYSGGGGGYVAGGGGYSSAALSIGQASYGSGLLLGAGTVGTLPCPRGTGFYRHPIDCNRFYRCVDYLPSPLGARFKIYEYNCPAGTVYSVEVWVCVWPYQPEAGRCFAGNAPDVILPGGQLPPIAPAIPFPPPIIGFSSGYASSGGGSSYDSPGYNDDDTNKGLLRAKSAATVAESNSISKSSPQQRPATPKSSLLQTNTNLFQSAGTDRPRCSAVGFFAHPLDCTQFAQCWKTGDGDITGFYFQVPGTVFFNVKIPVCGDEPVNVPDASSSSCQDKLQPS
ncbi:hypothetical protein BV898_15533 [Hypsibius exemplaris]|uniref:Chitin-binding type-2 domain-containing protein n=1 Tax=Hypsibius exemplaris TaxID=2072580 RepID=A0A9X6NE42_HYPEX|nr:hypothetical protein BV898_15533 [Hypsibius exemplaris]